jgi:PPOX class probable F420-dependent enzyme
MDEAEARRRVETARVARLGSLDPDGRLHLVPICFAVDGNTLYTAIDDKPKRSQQPQRLANVLAHPDVCVLVDEWDEDWSQLWWVRLRGRARVLETGEEHARAVAILRLKYGQYETHELDTVIAVDLDERRSWAAAPTSGSVATT